MNRFIRLICMIGCAYLLFPFTAAAQMTGMVFGNFGRLPLSDETSYRFETKNDSFSLVSRKDWDDLRTFGMYAGVANRHWALEFTADSLTDRSFSTDTAGRIDQLSFSLTRSIWSGKSDRLYLELMAGAGTIWLGDVQFSRLQEGVHFVDRVDRPFPHRYDDPPQSLIITANLLGQARFELPTGPLFAYASFEAGQTGFLRTSEWVEVIPFTGTPGVRLSVGYQWAQPYSSGGSVFSTTLESETGFQGGAVFYLGFLEAGFGYNFQTERQSGYAALCFGGYGSGVNRQRTPISGIQSVEIQSWPLMAAVRVRHSRWILEGRRTVIFSPTAGFESGPIQLSLTGNGITTYIDQQCRYEQAYLGLDSTAPVFSWMDVFILGAFGVRREQLNTSTEFASESLAEKTAPVWFLETGARWYVPNNERSEPEWGIGASIAVLYSNALETGVRTYAKFFITTVAGRKKFPSWKDAGRDLPEKN